MSTGFLRRKTDVYRDEKNMAVRFFYAQVEDFSFLVFAGLDFAVERLRNAGV